jgi:Lanthionine synthetase C-like protein
LLHEPDRHEPLQATAWDESRAREAVARFVADAERHFSPTRGWPVHPQDTAPGDDPGGVPSTLYFGACGVLWALRHLQAVGAAKLQQLPPTDFEWLLEVNRAELRHWGNPEADHASYLMGQTPILLMAYGEQPSDELADRLAGLIEGNLDHPARELMWGAPGTLLAALFLHEHSGDERWATLFRTSAERLWAQLETSPEHGCMFWTQDLYGRRSSCLDAVHGFVATASPLIRGRHLLGQAAWADWQRCIETTVQVSATWEGDQASWRVELHEPPGGRSKKLMQYCHGAPGFVVCLADLPGHALDDLLLAAGRATWAAGPLAKGSNLCHGTGGNGYAFLKLYQRTGDALWLDRARAFAMHGIKQTEADAARCGQGRYSLWTGDVGFAVYLWDCLNASARFPTLDVFYGKPP